MSEKFDPKYSNIISSAEGDAMKVADVKFLRELISTLEAQIAAAKYSEREPLRLELEKQKRILAETTKTFGSGLR